MSVPFQKFWDWSALSEVEYGWKLIIGKVGGLHLVKNYKFIIRDSDDQDYTESLEQSFQIDETIIKIEGNIDQQNCNKWELHKIWSEKIKKKPLLTTAVLVQWFHLIVLCIKIL